MLEILDGAQCAPTPLVQFALPESWGISLYLKNEAVLPSGSLKHRLARSLLRHGILSGAITSSTVLVDASSGSTAISEAWFARELGLRFVAVVPRSVSIEKVRLIESYGGAVDYTTDATTVCARAAELGAQSGWHFLDQFGLASTVTDYRDNNIASELFEQFPVDPTAIVVGAGTGGTSATIGRYIAHTGRSTRLTVVDPEGSAYYDAWHSGRADVTASGSRIEGIGRPRVEGAFVPSAIDDVVRIDDASSVAAMHLLADTTGLRAGPSTGTNLAGALQIAHRMARAGETGTLVTLACDSAERYGSTFYNENWVRQQGIDVAGASRRIHAALELV